MKCTREANLNEYIGGMRWIHTQKTTISQNYRLHDRQKQQHITGNRTVKGGPRTKDDKDLCQKPKMELSWNANSKARDKNKGEGIKKKYRENATEGQPRYP